jgi:hypothetical protein
MHLLAFSPLALLGSLALTSALSIPQPPSIDIQLPSLVVHKFPDPTWIENIAVRSTGDLVLTLATNPYLYYVNPVSRLPASLIHNFVGNAGILGITEVEKDHFYVLATNFSLTTFVGLNTNSVYSVNLGCYDPFTNTGAVISKVADVPRVVFGNGMDTLSVSKKLILIADSFAGTAGLFDVETGRYSILLQEPEFAPPPSTGFSLGINGIHVLPTSNSDVVYIYFDNTNQHLFGRVPLRLSTLKKVGPVEILANFTEQGFTTDDFTLDVEEGYAYLAGQQNQLLRIPLGGGEVVSVLGGLTQTVLAGPTSVQMGRGPAPPGTLYVTTNGALLNPVNGTFSEGGEVVAVETRF